MPFKVGSSPFIVLLVYPALVISKLSSMVNKRLRALIIYLYSLELRNIKLH